MKKISLSILLLLSLSVFSNNINVSDTPFISNDIEYGECTPYYEMGDRVHPPGEGPHKRSVTTCTYIYGVHVWTSTTYEFCSP